jgi:adenine-specific DNA-methyltransferase
MGSKFRLLPWIFDILCELDFNSAIDAFSGSGCVSYLLKCMRKRVVSNDFLNFPRVLSSATVANPGITLDEPDLEMLLSHDPNHRRFIERTFRGIFFTPDDLRFLDLVSWNVRKMTDPIKQDLATAAMVRACSKRQPRGVFTVAGDPEHYKDGRRDLRLSIREHFIMHVDAYNGAAFDNGCQNISVRSDVFDLDARDADLVYLDPPYVPRSDDNCYMKRYHFLEGLSNYWTGVEILQNTKVRKIRKPYTPFSYRRTAYEAFDRLFAKFKACTIVLSYSSNGFPDLGSLLTLMKKYKSRADVHRRAHRYHFGTHGRATRNSVDEYLIVGT